MFENIIGQESVVSSLQLAIRQDQLPGSLLFEGPPLLAKSSCALELARVTSCDRTAEWNCPCPQCLRQRLLVHPDLLMLGPKNLRQELRSAVDMMQNAPTQASRYFFIRSVRKLTNRFNPELYENEESRLSKIQPLIRNILEGLDQCRPEESSDSSAAAEAAKLLPLCEKLHDQIPDATPVFQIRSIEQHARLAPWKRQRLIIIEHADRMLDAARNALLKILEEPPVHSRFILTTNRRQAIIPTILSRVRPYRFVTRSVEANRQILHRIFRLDTRAQGDEQWSSIEAYFLSLRNAKDLDISGQASLFLAALIQRLELKGQQTDKAMRDYASKDAPDLEQASSAILKATSDFGAKNDSMAWLFPAFLEACSSSLSQILKDPQATLTSIRFAEKFAGLSRDCLMRFNSFNISPAALLERLMVDLTR